MENRNDGSKPKKGLKYCEDCDAVIGSEHKRCPKHRK